MYNRFTKTQVDNRVHPSWATSSGPLQPCNCYINTMQNTSNALLHYNGSPTCNKMSSPTLGRL